MIRRGEDGEGREYGWSDGGRSTPESRDPKTILLVRLVIIRSLLLETHFILLIFFFRILNIEVFQPEFFFFFSSLLFFVSRNSYFPIK